MKRVDLYGRVRHAVIIQGMSRREAARIFGIDRRTVDKMLVFSVPPGYRRKQAPARPKLDPFVGIIDQILETDTKRLKKQRHTSKRIFERLRDEHGFAGGITIVKDYVFAARQRQREMFVPLSHPPGHAQVDFGEALAVIGGVERKIHFLVMDLPQSDGCFVKAYPGETTEAFCDGHVSAFAFFGGVPQSILYDNTKIAVARILGDGRRQRTRVFGELISHYLFEDRFGRPGNYLGKYAIATPSKDRWKKLMGEGIPGRVTDMYEWETSMSGLAAVWATENTRTALWDAMKRKEVYATTGPRMRVRMFGGFDLKKIDAYRKNMAAIGYEKGVPMGGDLSNAPEGTVPTFLIAALRDPDGANLDRIQIVKGWLDSDGRVHERVYDVAVSDGRGIVDGKVTSIVGSTVDLETASYTNTIGDAALIAGWTDPDFDPGLKGFYYARVIEIPTPRWTAYDVVRLGAEMPEETRMVLQERAYTSPIWYTP